VLVTLTVILIAITTAFGPLPLLHFYGIYVYHSPFVFDSEKEYFWARWISLKIELRDIISTNDTLGG
jgi:hypothetical protein